VVTTIAIALGAFCESSNLASFEPDAIALAIEPLWNLKINALKFWFEWLAIMIAIDVF